MLVINRGRRAGEIVDRVDLHEQREGHVVPHELESRVVQQMADIASGSREQVVDAQDVAALTNQSLAQVGAKEAGAASNQNSFLFRISPSHAVGVSHCFSKRNAAAVWGGL